MSRWSQTRGSRRRRGAVSEPGWSPWIAAYSGWRRFRRKVAVDHGQVDAATIGQGGQRGSAVGQRVEACTGKVGGEAVAIVGHGQKNGRSLHWSPSVRLERLRTAPLLGAPTRTTMGPGPIGSRQRYWPDAPRDASPNDCARVRSGSCACRTWGSRTRPRSPPRSRSARRPGPNARRSTGPAPIPPPPGCTPTRSPAGRAS